MTSALEASNINKTTLEDFDPLADINVTVDILTIRALDKIDEISEPDFYVKIIINEEEFTSDIWYNTEYIYEPVFSAELNVPDDEENVTVEIQLWDSNYEEDVICDIGDENNYAQMQYSIKTGHWTGDDELGDYSGYGRLCGTDDESIYENEKDCEIWFNIHQNDYDNDKVPYWMESNEYNTDPEVDNSNDDTDDDNVTLSWEWAWGYDPLVFDDHKNIDSDVDSITNYEEYITSINYSSDPFRQDIFLEIDWMQDGPNSEKSAVPKKAEERIKNPFHRRNIVFHFDTGKENGGELIPFAEKTSNEEVLEIYDDYFLHNGKYDERRSIFHYGIVVYLCNMKGYGFSGDTPPYMGYIPGTNGFVISSSQMEKNTEKLMYKDRSLDNFYGSAMMHEMGHNFGIRFGEPFGCDNWIGKYPWQISFWLIRNYKSMMNYQYTYRIFDYSDGTHRWGDYDDWANIDLTYFEVP